MRVPLPQRRRLLLAAAAAPLAAHAQATVEYPAVTPRALVFPRDHGAHPDYRIEWWYLTGWLDRPSKNSDPGSALGFQITFFRLRTEIDPNNPSRFAAHQLLIAHVALADPAEGHLLVDDRIARAGFGNHAEEHDTGVTLDGWRFARRAADGSYECAMPARDYTLRFTATLTQPLLLQGAGGVSQKGPNPAQASYYYSAPHLAIDAELQRKGTTERLRGRAWLDHEWSSTLLDPGAAGWDWLGVNLDDGAALTAFQIRRRDGSTLYAYAALRAAGTPAARLFGPEQVSFEPLQHWRSPRTQGNYPVAQRVRLGSRVFETRPLMSDQELDSRATSGVVYWEGASELLEHGRRVGRGYLELTGYAGAVAL
jgi:predicted secreted hydrolase